MSFGFSSPSQSIPQNLTTPLYPPDTPTILCSTITLSELMQMVWAYNGYKNADSGLVLPRELGNKFIALDPGEIYYHVETPLDRPGVSHLYAIKDWRESGERRLKEKRRAEFERQDRAYKDECIVKIISILEDHPVMGFMTKEHRNIVARKIVMDGNEELAKQFGVTEGLTYKGEIKI